MSKENLGIIIIYLGCFSIFIALAGSKISDLKEENAYLRGLTAEYRKTVAK